MLRAEGRGIKKERIKKNGKKGIEIGIYGKQRKGGKKEEPGILRKEGMGGGGIRKRSKGG
jgi:hypothetical protein